VLIIATTLFGKGINIKKTPITISREALGVCLNFISRLFESYFYVDFDLGKADNSGLFSNFTSQKMQEIASKKPKLIFKATD